MLRVFLFAGPGYEEKLKEEHLQKQRDAVEARAKLSEFERLVDPNNKEMMDMLAVCSSTNFQILLLQSGTRRSW